MQRWFPNHLLANNPQKSVHSENEPRSVEAFRDVCIPLNADKFDKRSLSSVHMNVLASAGERRPRLGLARALSATGPGTFPWASMWETKFSVCSPDCKPSECPGWKRTMTTSLYRTNLNLLTIVVSLKLFFFFCTMLLCWYNTRGYLLYL